MNLKDTSSINLNVSRFRESLVNFIVPLICIAFTVVITVVVLIPSFKEKPILLVDLDKSQTLNKQLRDKKAVLNELVDLKSVVEEDAQLLDKVLVSEARVPELLAQVSITAKESGFEVTRLAYSYEDPSKAPPTGVGSTAPTMAQLLGYQNVKVVLGARGSDDQLITFLSSIEDAARLVDAESYRFSRDKDGILEVSVTLISPYQYVESSAVTDESITFDITSPEFMGLIDKVKALRVYEITSEDISAVEEVFENMEAEEPESPVELPGEGGTPF